MNITFVKQQNFTPIFDINYSGIEEKFVNSNLHACVILTHIYIHNGGNSPSLYLVLYPLMNEKCQSLAVNRCTDIPHFD